MKKLLLLALLPPAMPASSQIFSQSFQSSASIANYVKTSDLENGHFNSIGTTGSGTSVGIINGKLVYNRNGSNTGSFSRTTDINSTNFLSVKFELSVTENSAATTTAAVFQFGSGFATNNTAEANSEVHSKIGINIGSNPGEFSLRNISGSQSSPVVSGPVNVTWVINNTGFSQSYTSPAGIVESVASDKFDVWISSTKVFDEASATTPTQSLTDFKFVFSNGSGTISIDDIVINELVALPVSLTSFSGISLKDEIQINWSTAAESNSNYFDLLKSTDGKSFFSIGRVKAQGISSEPFSYSFSDHEVVSGWQYYQLSQVDNDGKESRSEIIQIQAKPSLQALTVSRISEQSIELSLVVAKPSRGQLTITDLSGRKLRELTLNLKKGDNRIPIPCDQTGLMLVASFRGEEGTFSAKFLK